MNTADAHFFTYAGFTLNAEEKVVLASSLLQKQNEEKLVKTILFAKIAGVKSDYYLAYGCNADVFERKCFYCSDMTTWLQLPDVKEKDLLTHSLIQGPFTGDPSFEYRYETESEARTMNEETRLACTIVDLTYDTTVVPRGAYFRSASRVLASNPHFHGLPEQECGSLANYFNLRQGFSVDKVSIVKRGETFSEAIDIFETLDSNVPSSAWSLQENKVDKVVVIKSFKWPGSFFYHAGSNYANFYCGTGLKNEYVALMLV